MSPVILISLSYPKRGHKNKISIEDRVGFEPTMKISLTRLTVWTFRPLKQPILILYRRWDSNPHLKLSQHTITSINDISIHRYFCIYYINPYKHSLTLSSVLYSINNNSFALLTSKFLFFNSFI